MPPGQTHEHIFETRLARGQMLQFAALLFERSEQRRNRQVRLLHVQRDQAVIFADRLDARQATPCLGR